jgi:hypothetical protein
LVEWIFAFETRRIVSRSKIDNVVDDIVKLLEYAKGFPQEHLMSAGQLLLNPVSTSLRFPFACLANKRRKQVRTPGYNN